jgi:hypothetical protein
MWQPGAYKRSCELSGVVERAHSNVARKTKGWVEHKIRYAVGTREAEIGSFRFGLVSGLRSNSDLNSQIGGIASMRLPLSPLTRRLAEFGRQDASS